MSIFRFSSAFCAVLFMALSVCAYTVDPDTKTITTNANEEVAYSDISSYGTEYTINLAEGSVLTHTAWVFNPLTGTGTFNLAPTGTYDNPQQNMPNLTGFSGTVQMGTTTPQLRLRGSGYNTFSPDMTLDITGNSQLWLNSDLNCKLYLHDMGGAFDGLGLVRFDTNGKKITGPISVSGKAGISVRQDLSNATNTIESAITGVHAADDTTKDNLVFNGSPSRVNTYATLVLKSENYWNGTTEIDYMNVELQGSATLGDGTIYLSPSKSVTEGSSTYTTWPGTLTLNRTDDFTLSAIQSTSGGAGGKIVKKNDNTVTVASLSGFNGTVDIQGGTVQTSAVADGSAAGGIILTGTGTLYATNTANNINFNINRFDLSQFEGTFSIQQGRTFMTYAKYFGPDATVKVDSGASFMFYDGSAMGPCGDYPSKFVLSGNGHSEGLGSVRFHVTLDEASQAKLNTAEDVSLPNITGPVELASNTKIISRVGNVIGWGAIAGDITGTYTDGDTTGAYNLTLNDSSNGWLLLTGTNDYGETTIGGGTVQLGYVGSINGKQYDGTTGTLGKGKVTVNASAVLDYRRVNEYNFTADIANAGTIKVNSGALTINQNPSGDGTIEVAEGAALNVNLALNTSNKIMGTGTVNMTWTSDSGVQINGFSDFEGTLNINSNNGRYRLDGKTVQFGPGRTIIGNTAQLYMNGSTFYGNFEFGNSSAYDGTYPAAIRSDGTGTSRIFGTVTLTDDGATICNRANNNGNVENGSKLVLYADVTGPGSLTKREDSAGNAGVLTFATTTQDGTTYGGTVDYEGKTNVKTGILRVAEGVTMYGQDDITVDSGAVMDLQEGSTLAVGAKDAATGTTLNVGGAGELRFNSDIVLDIFSATEFDQLLFGEGLTVTSDPDADKLITVNVADGVDLGDTLIPVIQGLNPGALADWTVSVSSGFTYLLQADGTLAIGSSAAIPEPSTLILLVLGFGLIAGKIGRKRF
ncbi:MAG: PEP-CTERM sorting domain-containing protein [Thermoguttaceae bacterium]|nr:PEP-CTERM sorting domain-containing protein [Thermoguttaceae bacterium]